MNRRQFCAGVVATALPIAEARAQAWPDRPVNLILSQPPGSGPDNIARLLADRLAGQWARPVVILNKPGGQNVIGAQAAARSAPDGYSFYFATTAALVSNAYLFKQLPYDPVKDFDPVAFVATSPFGIIVPGSSAIQSFDAFMAASKAAPDKLSFANEGPRTLGGMTARLLNARAGIRNTLVPYASAAVGIQDALAGRVDAIIVDLASTAQHIRRGDLRLLATTSARRVKGWESTPAVAETLPGFDMPGWFAVVAPAGTPKDVVARVNRDITTALADPTLAERIEAVGPLVAAERSPEQTGDFLRQEHARWSVIAREIEILPE